MGLVYYSKASFGCYAQAERSCGSYRAKAFSSITACEILSTSSYKQHYKSAQIIIVCLKTTDILKAISQKLFITASLSVLKNMERLVCHPNMIWKGRIWHLYIFLKPVTDLVFVLMLVFTPLHYHRL